MEEVSLTINEAKLRKMADEMLRQRCTLGDEHQYHIDQIKNFLKSDIKGNSGSEKIVLSLHKFPAIIFNDDDIEERTSRWVNKKQKEPGKLKEDIYSNSKIVQPDYKNLNKNNIEDIYLLIMNGKIPDYADTELLWSLSVFIRSLVIWERVHHFQLGIESYQQKVNLTAPTITFPGIEEHDIKIKALTIDEAKLRKMADEMLRQRCTSGDEHQYYFDQMKNFWKSDIVWESRKEILVSLHPRKTTPLVHMCQKDPEAPALSLINQDLLYLKKGNFGPEKIVLSLHKFPAIIFNDDDIEERTSRWVNKSVKKFNPYARYVFIRSSVIWERVHDFQLGIESYQQKVNLTAPTMTFPGIKDHEIVLEGLKSYNNDVKYGYVQKDLTKDETEYLKLFEEEIEERLKHRRQMRRWEMSNNAKEGRKSELRKRLALKIDIGRTPFATTDDDDYTIAINPLATKEPVNSLIWDKHLTLVRATESDEETNTFDNYLPENETFCFDLEEISSGRPTTHSDLSLPDYEAFYNDHIKEKSSGSTTTHSDFSLYDSFIFDLSINPFPPADRSDFYHEEFTDELAHIISRPDVECFHVNNEPDPGDLTSIDPGIRENVSTTNVNIPFEDA
ncbi:hypothetical protein Tco_0969267 [Tanacetum coccineum]